MNDLDKIICEYELECSCKYNPTLENDLKILEYLKELRERRLKDDTIR